MDTGTRNTSPVVIAFVCLHGSAKSLIAAEYLNRIAAQRGLAFHATAAGLEPDPAIPSHVVRGLAEQGFNVEHRVPAAASEANLAAAHRIIAFGCDLPAAALHARAVEQWADCPAVSEGFDPAWQYITARIDRLLEASRGTASTQGQFA